MLKSKNPNYSQYVQLKISRNKFLKHLGFQITKIGEGFVEGQIELKEFLEQQNGFFHGGVVSSICDVVCGYAAYSLVSEAVQVFTVELKVSYLRKARGENLFVTGAVIKPGRNIYFCEAEVFSFENDRQILIAKASSTMAVVNEKVNDKYGD